ncbi:MAG: polysulfide reductase NrfD [Chloroflexota bacterium]|nr:polysulfide reductase NrfD [Chloroflexota bacterium]
MPEHFAVAPNWEWWILAYFFFGGIAGGTYAIGTLIRLFGAPADQGAARTAFLVSFIALIPCPIFLSVDLGQPVRFWHMLVDTSAGGPSFKYWSPMSVGSWALLLFGVFSFVSFLGALGQSGTSALSGVGRWLAGAAGAAWSVIGSGLGFFIAGYTGVLLAVSNEGVWSDAGWVLGGMFLASALSGSAALLLLLWRGRHDAQAGTVTRLEIADRNFVILEAILILLFLASVAAAGTIGKLLGALLVLWLLVLIGLAAPFTARGARMGAPAVASPLLALLGVLALRALVIFGGQL